MSRAFTLVGGLLLAAVMAGAAQASTVVLQPAEVDSKDVFVYESFKFVNFDNFPAGPNVNFGELLSAVNTGSSPHNVKSLIDFTLPGNITNASQIQSAKLTLNVIDGAVVGFPIANPSGAFPVTIEAYAIGATWTETGVIWDSQPASTGSALDSQVINGVNKAITWDVTKAVTDWLNNPGTQFGLLLSQAAEVRNGDSGAVGAVFASSQTKLGDSLRPSLTLTVVPEPASLAMLALGAATAVFFERRRRTSRR